MYVSAKFLALPVKKRGLLKRSKKQTKREVLGGSFHRTKQFFVILKTGEASLLI